MLEMMEQYLPSEEAVQAACTSVGLPALGPHLQLVVTSFLAFFLLQFISSVTFPVVFPDHFETFDDKTKLDWDMHFVRTAYSSLLAVEDRAERSEDEIRVMRSREARRCRWRMEHGLQDLLPACDVIFRYWKRGHDICSSHGVADRIYLDDVLIRDGKTTTGWIHALVSAPLALYILLLPSPAVSLDPLFAYAPLEGTVFAISAGYFYYDLAISLYHVRTHGLPFVVHAMSSCLIFTFVWRPLLMGVGSLFLIWEFSTIFLHPHWWLDRLNMTGSLLQLANGVFLLSSFFATRIVFGGISTYRTWFVLDDPRIGIYFAWGFRLASLALGALNWTWFRLMILTIQRRFATRSQGKTGTGEASKADGRKSTRVEAFKEE